MANSNLEQLSERGEYEHMADLDFIVSLKGQSGNRGGDLGGVLQKGVENAQEMSLGRIVEYMLDPREDASNPPYNQDEIRVANRIKDWRASAKTSANSDAPDRFEIMYLGRDEVLSNPVEPTSYVSAYPDMIKEKVKRTDFGEEVRYNGVDLIARFVPGGGTR